MRKIGFLLVLVISATQFVDASAAPNIPTLPQGMYFADPIKPSIGGTANTHLCRAGWVITQIQVSKIAPNQYLPGFRFVCSPISNTGEIGPATDAHEIVNMGVTINDYAIYSCPEGQAFFSISAYTERYVKDVNGDCATPYPFRGVFAASKGIGFGWPTNAKSSCNELADKSRIASFMTGIYASAAAGVDSLQSICGNFQIHKQAPSPKDLNFDYQNGILKATTGEVPSMDIDPIIQATLESECLEKTGDGKIAGAFADNKFSFAITSQKVKDCLGTDVYVRYQTNFSVSIPLKTKMIAPTVVIPDEMLVPLISYTDKRIILSFPISPQVADGILNIYFVFNSPSNSTSLKYQGKVVDGFSVFTMEVEDYIKNISNPVFIEISNNASTTPSKPFLLSKAVSHFNLSIPRPVISTKSGKVSISLEVNEFSAERISQAFLVIDGKVFPQASIKNKKRKSINFQFPLKLVSRSTKPEIWILSTDDQIARGRISIRLPIQ